MARSTARLTHNRLPKIAEEVGPSVARALERGAHAIAEEAKSRVPVRTGKLRNAIHVEKSASGGRYADRLVKAGDSKAFYGHMVEFGTTHSAAHPFLIPAFESKKPLVQSMVRRELDRL